MNTAPRSGMMPGIKPGVIRTYTGLLVDVRALRRQDVKTDDIAHALANTCRWGGHSSQFFSVAQHSCNCADSVYRKTADAEATLYTLLHDAGEAYIGDIPTPIKCLFPGLLEIEERILETVYEALIPHSLSPAARPLINGVVKNADRVALNHEWCALMQGDIEMELWLPLRAAAEFKKRYTAMLHLLSLERSTDEFSNTAKEGAEVS